jgi:hypothetical protein
MNRRRFITTVVLAIPTIAIGSSMSLPTVKYKYEYTHEYDWDNQIQIFSNEYLSLYGVKTMDYCASVVDDNGNIGGIDNWRINRNKTEPFIVKMHVLESLPCYTNSKTIDLTPALAEILEKMECVTQTIWLKDKTINKMVPFVRGLSKKRYKRMVGMMNATTKEECEEILKIYE